MYLWLGQQVCQTQPVFPRMRLPFESSVYFLQYLKQSNSRVLPAKMLSQFLNCPSEDDLSSSELDKAGQTANPKLAGVEAILRELP